MTMFMSSAPNYDVTLTEGWKKTVISQKASDPLAFARFLNAASISGDNRTSGKVGFFSILSKLEKMENTPIRLQEKLSTVSSSSYADYNTQFKFVTSSVGVCYVISCRTKQKKKCFF